MALLLVVMHHVAAQNAPTINEVAAPPGKTPSEPATIPQRTPPPPAPAVKPPDTPPANRITGIRTNREMVAAEEPTEIVIRGSAVARCGLAVDFGDGTRSANLISESSPFPLRLAHIYPKTEDVIVRVTGTVEGSAPPCEGAKRLTQICFDEMKIGHAGISD